MALFSLSRKRDEKSSLDGAASRRQADAWLAAIARGDHGAFEALMGRYLGRVHAIAWRILRDGAEAEDVAQETFLRLWREAARLGPVPAEAWLYRVASNLAIDRWRRRKPELSGDLPPVADGRPGSDNVLARAEIVRGIEQAMDALPERQRVALVLVHFEELPQKQAAEVMGLSLDALESLLARARRNLKDRLAGKAGEMLDDFNEVQS